MPDELNAISVGLQVNLGSLDRDIAKIQKQVASVEGDHTINFSVGKVNVAAVREQLRQLTRSALPIPLNATVARGSAAVLRRELMVQLKAAGPVPIQITANLSASEISRIRAAISKGVGSVPIGIKPGGAGGGGGPSSSAPVTPHERRVADDLAAKVGRTLKSAAAQPAVGRVAPTPPLVASSSAGVVATPPRASTGRTARTAVAVPLPAKITEAEAIPQPPKGSLASYFRRKAEKRTGQRVSPDELRAQTRRVGKPETPEEIEYASRPMQVSLPGNAQTEFEQEKRGRGVRGASRSGARLRNEPVLTPTELNARDIQREDVEAKTSSARNAAIRAPARQSAAYYGKNTGSRLDKAMAGIQFYKFDPVLGQAYGKLNEGDTAGARALLRGFSAKLVGVDPRERKKFFRLFRNVENVPPELLEKDAALRALFGEIHSRIDPAYTNVPSASTLRGTGRSKPKAPISGRRSANPVDRAIAEMDAGNISREEFELRFPTLKGRAGGGPVFGRGPKMALPGISPADHEEFQKAVGRFRRDFPGSAKRLHGISAFDPETEKRPFQLPWQSAPPAFTVPRGDKFDVRISKGLLSGQNPSVRDRRSGTIADLSGLVGVLEHELGHVIDKSHGGALSALAAKEDPFVSPYSATDLSEKAAEMFAANRFKQPREMYPNFYAGLDELSKNERRHRAGGGPIKGGLMARIAAQKMKDAYLVGEHHPETYISKTGKAEIVGEHGPEVRQFPEEGKIEPFVPVWLRNLKAKDMTRRAAGGPVRGAGGRFLRQGPKGPAGFALVGDPYLDAYPDALHTPGAHGGILVGEPTTTSETTRPKRPVATPEPAPLYRRPPATEYGGALAAEPGSGLGGRKKIREAFEGERAAVAKGGLSPSGGVQRVFVTNWPGGGRAGFGGMISTPRGAQLAAGGLRFSDRVANSEEAPKWLKDLIGNTQPVTPKEPRAETARMEALGPEERAAGRISARLEAVSLEQRLSATAHGVSEKEQLLPSRGAGVMGGQLFQTLFGERGAAQTRAKQAREAVNAATKATGAYRAEQVKLNDALAQQEKASTPEQKEEAQRQVEKLGKSTATYRKEAERLTTTAESAEKAVIGTAGAIRSAATGLAGIAVFSTGFGVVLGATQAGLAGITSVFTPLIDRATGFKGVSAEITKQLGEQVRAQQGAVQTTIAQKEAQAGLSDEVSKTIAPLLQQRAVVEGGNAAFGDQLDLLRTARNVKAEEALGAAGAPTGPFQPPGGVPGVTRSTGGFLGSPIGATPSLFEQLAGEAGQTPIQQGVRGLSEILFGPNNPVAGALGSGEVKSPAEISQVVQDQLKNPKGVDIGAISAATGPALALSDSLNTMKTGLDKVDSKFEIVGQSSAKWNERIQQSSNFQLALNGVSQDLIKSFDKLGGFAVINRKTGEAISSREEFKQAFDDVLKSATVPDVKQLLQQLTERIIPAQKAQFRAEAGLQRGVLVPGQFALGQLAAPTPGTAGGPAFEAGLVGKGDKAAAKVAAAYKSQIGGAVTFVNDQIAKGHQALLNLVPADTRQEFSGLLDQITKTGQQISQIQTGVQQQQVNLDVAEYNNQLRIARRSLQDAKDLQAGIAGATKDTLGGLEGENALLSRQLQLLQFMLEQRQINFRLATAGFVTPGQTPEEIAARIAEAKKEAEFAQKQLDIQKQLAANQFKGIKITATRDVIDLIRQVDLLQQGRALTINAAAANRTLDVLNKKEQQLVALAGTYIEEGAKIASVLIQTVSQVQQQTGKGFEYILGETAKAWGIFGGQFQAMMDTFTGAAPSTGTGRTTTGGGGSRIGAASGILGDTLGPTQLTVGEVKGEKVAVLKNPHLVPASVLAPVREGPAGGGALSLTIIVTGNHISDALDEHALAQRVANQVEQTLMRKTSLFGLRRL
jgi:hypothetical protein